LTLLIITFIINSEIKKRGGFLKVYTTEEIAEILRVHKRTVLNEISRGNLEAKKVGNKYRIIEEALKKYMKND